MAKFNLFVLMLAGVSGLSQAGGAPQIWGFMNREGSAPCLPLNLMNSKYLKAMSLEDVMASFSPSGYKTSTYPLQPLPERGLPFTVPTYIPNSGAAPLMSKESCQKLEAALIKSGQLKPAAAVPEKLWTEGDSQR